jgi:prophage regulatory protein
MAAQDKPQECDMAQKLLRLPEVKACVGLSRSEIYRREALGLFPQRVSIGDRSVAWVAEEVQAWIEARMRARSRNDERIARPGEMQSTGA